MSTHAVIGGVLQEVAPSAPVVGGVLRQATEDYGVVGGVLRQVWVGLPPKGGALNSYTWTEIAQVAAAGRASQYWAVGDTKTAKLNGYTYHMRIIGYDHDELADSDALYGTGYNRGMGKAAITFETAELTSQTHPLTRTNSQGYAVGGDTWDQCTMRTEVMPLYRGYMPADLQAGLRTVIKVTGMGYPNGSKVVTTADTLFLQSVKSVYTGYSNIGPAEEGPTYAYYTGGGSKKKYPAGDTYSNQWWTRTRVTSTGSRAYMVDYLGSGVTEMYVTSSFHIPFAFCI